MKIMRRFLLFGVLTAFFGCATASDNVLFNSAHDPVLIGEGTEIEIGNSVDASIKKEYAVSKDQKLNEYINDVGQDLVQFSSRKKLKFRFTVLDDKLVNAFAAPGGYIYITTGILKMLKNEAELAGVLGHEIGHVVHKHSLKAIQRQIIATMGIQIVAATMGANRSNKMSQELVLLGGQVGMTLLLLKNSRENELQADNEGVLIMNRAGYSPQAMVNIQEMLLKMSGGKHPPEIISTHPPSEERIKAIRQQISTLTNASTGFYQEDYQDGIQTLR